MSDVTSHSVVNSNRVAVAQYTSLRSALAMTMQRQDWKVEQVSELKKNLTFFEVPPASIEPIRAKLDMKIFDEYTNILKGMYSIRCNGRSEHGGTSVRPVHGRSDHGDTPS